MSKIMDQMSLALLLCFVILPGKSFGQFEDYFWDENVNSNDDRSFSLNDSFDEKPLIGRPDGHEPTEKPLFGRPDGHEPTEKPLFGRPDGHEPTEKPLIGRPDGHEPTEKPLFGRPDGHELTENMNDEEVSEWSEDDDDDSMPLARCKRPICSTYCNYGFQTDANGCPVCKCLEDPCQGVRCTDGKVCHQDKCQDSRSCVKLSAQCISRSRSCPEPMCANYCPNGYAHNEEGCMTCSCQTTMSIPEKVEDDRSSCPMVMCAEICVSGYQKNDHGCNTCTCVDISIEQSSCGELFCDVAQDCQSRNFTYYCVPKSLCHLAQEMAYMKRNGKKMKMMNMTKQFVPECEANGSFNPIQCHLLTSECWCVDDRGKEIAGTRASDSESQLQCKPNVTMLVNMHIVLSSYDDAANEMEEKEKEYNFIVSSASSKNVLENAFSSWLLMEKQSVLLMKVEQSTKSSISAHLKLKNNGTVDLPSAIEYMKREMRMGHCQVALENIQAENIYFVPNVDTLIVEHQYNFEPLIATAANLGDPFEGCGKILLVVATMLLLFMILTLLSVLLVHYHWRNKRSMQFRHHKLENQLSHEQRNFVNSEVAGESAVVLVSSNELKKTHLLV